MLVPEGFRPNASNQTDIEFNGMIAQAQKQPTPYERDFRHATYRKVSRLVGGLLPGNGAAECVHAHPLELNNECADRLLFICRDRVPGHGNLLRIVINDTVHEPVSGARKLLIRDFVVSPTQKVMTFQHSIAERSRDKVRWSVTPERGPLLQKLHDSLLVSSGDKYDIHVPKTSGYPKAPTGLLEQRVLMESLADDLSMLSGVTAEPGHPSAAGIMS